MNNKMQYTHTTKYSVHVKKTIAQSNNMDKFHKENIEWKKQAT